MEKLNSMYYHVKMWWLNYSFQYICWTGKSHAVIYVLEIFHWKSKSQVLLIHSECIINLETDFKKHSFKYTQADLKIKVGNVLIYYAIP